MFVCNLSLVDYFALYVHLLIEFVFVDCIHEVKKCQLQICGLFKQWTEKIDGNNTKLADHG